MLGPLNQHFILLRKWGNFRDFISIQYFRKVFSIKR